MTDTALTITLRAEWLIEAYHALGPTGTNDEEHDLLVEIVDAVEWAEKNQWSDVAGEPADA